jgi:hypothetical protein
MKTKAEHPFIHLSNEGIFLCLSTATLIKAQAASRQLYNGLAAHAGLG